MEPITMSFMPTPEDLRFFSEAQGIRYAVNAGFEVNVDLEKGTTIASRPDMLDREFILKKDREKPNRLVWVEVR